MEQKNEKKQVMPLWQRRQLALALAATALLALIVSSMAWLSNVRTLQTITRMQMPILFLPKDTSHPRVDVEEIQLGNLDFSAVGSKEIPFVVYATMDTEYYLQVAHTTNLPLTYSIFPQGENTDILNADAETGTYSWSYGIDDIVHDAAKPVYHQTVKREIGREELQYYSLVVTWKTTDVSPKETDMVYLTVATANLKGSTETGGGT